MCDSVTNCEVDTSKFRVGRDSSVGIATRYGLDGPGIESRWGRDFRHLSRQVLWPMQPPIEWILGLFPRGKAAGVWRWPPTPYSAEVKERVGLYLCSSSLPSCPVVGRTLHLPSEKILETIYSTFFVFLTCAFLSTVFVLRVLLSYYMYLFILCVFVVPYVYLLYYVCIAALTLDAGLLARSQYPEGPATGHLDWGFSWFPCVYKRMLRWFPSFQVATTCLSCSPPDLNFLVNFFFLSIFVYM